MKMILKSVWCGEAGARMNYDNRPGNDNSYCRCIYAEVIDEFELNKRSITFVAL